MKIIDSGLVLFCQADLRSKRGNMYKEKIRENIKLIFAILFIIYVLSFGYLRLNVNSWSYFRYNFCKIDLLLLILMPNYIGTFLSMTIAYLFLHITKYDFNTNLILRYKSKKKIWLRQCVHIIVNSFIIICSVILFDFINGIFYGKETYNWNTNDSMFFGKTHELAANHKQYFVMISIIVIGTLIISIISILCNLIYWITSSQIISCFITVSFCLWNLYEPNFAFNLFSRTKLNEIDYISGDKLILDIIILPLILTALIFLSLFIIKKKEFLNDTRR